MTDYVANQSGAFSTPTVWTPNGVPGAGDTINTGAYAITGVSGVLGDTTNPAAPSPITIQAGGSITLSGNIELRPRAGIGGIAFQGGTLEQGGHTITVAPPANGAHAATLSTANLVWNSSSGAQLLFSNANGATSCHLFAKANTTAYTVTINWAYQVVDGFGLGQGTPAMDNHYIKTGDTFTWLGGRVSNCGRFNWRDGGGSVGHFNVQNLAIGWWNGTGYGESQNECVWRIERSAAGAQTAIFANNLWYKDITDNRTIQAYMQSTYSPIDMSGSVFLNVPLITDSVAHDFSDCITTTVLDGTVAQQPANFGIGIRTYGAAKPNLDRLSVLILQDSDINPHVPVINGSRQWSANYTDVTANMFMHPTVANVTGLVYTASGSGTTGATEPTWPTVIGQTVNDNGITWTARSLDDLAVTINDFLADGLGGPGTGEVGDMPIANIPVVLNRPVMIHGAGAINPSLSTMGKVSIDRLTLHNALGIILGETTGRPHHIGTVRNSLISDPIGGAFIYDGGLNLVTQTGMTLDYIAFDAADMNAGNETHPQLGGLGYVGANVAPYINSYGTNDIAFSGSQFPYPTRHGLTWAASLGYAQSVVGLRDALLAGFGVNSSGSAITVNANATHANYRAYIAAGYTPTNAAFNGTGFGGSDIGAFDVSAADSTAPTVTAFTINTPNITGSTVFTINSFTASDNVGVTHYMVTTSSTPPLANDAGWLSSAPGTHNVQSYGNYTLYPWVKDAAGNVSAVYGTPVSVSAQAAASTVNFGLGFNGGIHS